MGAYNGTETKWVRYNRNERWEYSDSDREPSFGREWDGSRNIYLVYTSNGKLTTVDTVDSTAEGVHMYMIDYEEAAFSGGGYGTGDTKEGLASKTVDRNTGWPSLTGKSGTPEGKSFSALVALW